MNEEISSPYDQSTSKPKIYRWLQFPRLESVPLVHRLKREPPMSAKSVRLQLISPHQSLFQFINPPMLHINELSHPGSHRQSHVFRIKIRVSKDNFIFSTYIRKNTYVLFFRCCLIQIILVKKDQNPTPSPPPKNILQTICPKYIYISPTPSPKQSYKPSSQ